MTPEDIRDAEFSVTRMKGGYAPNEVDALLDKVATELRARDEELTLTRAKVAEQQRTLAELTAKLQEYTNRPTTAIPVHNATRILEAAQRAADEVIVEAEKHAKDIVDEARGQADIALKEARATADSTLDDAEAEAEATLRKAKEEANRATNGATVRVRRLEAEYEDLKLREKELRKFLAEQLTAITDGLNKKEQP